LIRLVHVYTSETCSICDAVIPSLLEFLEGRYPVQIHYHTPGVPVPAFRLEGSTTINSGSGISKQLKKKLKEENWL